jgi:hypothetical protein
MTMNLEWQDFVALGIVFTAITYLIRLSWTAVMGKTVAGSGPGCGSCAAGGMRSSSRSTEPDRLVSIGAINQHLSVSAEQTHPTDL